VAPPTLHATPRDHNAATALLPPGEAGIGRSPVGTPQSRPQGASHERPRGRPLWFRRDLLALVFPVGLRVHDVGLEVLRANLVSAVSLESMSFTRITVRADQMGGVPCIRGQRIPVATVVGMVADGMSEQEILTAYPDLVAEDVREAMRYAADAVRERELPLVASA
jgi:uncharacterized protein (DUF433 family)